MKKPEIQIFFDKQKTTIRNKIGFLSVGASALFFSPHLSWLNPIIIMSGIVPMIVDLKEVKKMAKDEPYPSGSRFTYFLNKSLKKWTTKYINNSDSLMEKKYKALFLNLWTAHKETSIDDIVYSNPELFKELSSTLIKEGITKNDLFKMMIDSSESVDSNGERIVIKDFFMEDVNSPENFAIAKKIFEEYQDIGLIGKSFLQRNNYEVLLYLQNYKFSNMDYQLIKNFTQELDDGKHSILVNQGSSYINRFRYDDVSKETIMNVVNNENDINNLQILKDYYDTTITLYNICRLGIDTKVGDLEETKDFIDKKLEYLKLGTELDVQYYSKANKRIKL